MKYQFGVMLLGMALASSVQADFVTGEREFDNRNYTAAFREFITDADNGDFRAQYYIGYLYLYGLGVNQNDKKALEYIQSSADKGYSNAQVLLGYLYDEGTVVSQNKKKAIELYKQAAEQNNATAMLNLGLAYYRGDTVMKDEKKAIQLLEQVPLDAQPMVGRFLGGIYLSGAQPNMEKATSAYLTSAKAGDVESFYELSQIYFKNSETGKAVNYCTYAASQGFAPAQYLLGTLYVNGEGVNRDIIQGHAWLEMAANQKYAPAIQALTTISKEMTLTESEKARREFNRLQQSVLNQVESPFIIEQRQAEEQRMADEAVQAEQKTRRRRR